MKRRLTLLATAVGVASLVSACMGDATGPAILGAPAGVFSADTYQKCATLWAGHHVAESELGIPQGATVTYGPADGTGREISWCVDVTEGGYDPNALCDHTNWWQPHCDEVPLQFFIVDQWTTSGGGGGGGGSGGECDPRIHPTCLKFPTPEQQQLLFDWRSVLKPDAEIAPADSALCAEIVYTINELFDHILILVGNVHLDDGPDGPHEGLTIRSSPTLGTHMHIDENVFTAASSSIHGRKLLTALLMHEFAHLTVNAYTHPSGQTNGIYTDAPFNRLSPNSQHACIAF